MAHYKKSVIKSKTSKHMIYILRITTILFPMKQSIQETSKWPLWYDSECAVNPLEHIRKYWTSSWAKPRREEHPQILVFRSLIMMCLGINFHGGHPIWSLFTFLQQYILVFHQTFWSFGPLFVQIFFQKVPLSPFLHVRLQW